MQHRVVRKAWGRAIHPSIFSSIISIAGATLVTMAAITPTAGWSQGKSGGGGGSAGMNGFSVATGIMAMTNSTKQGGQGSEGSTLLTQTDLSYHGGWWGGGVFFQYDMQGDSQTDLAVGPRLELIWKPFYFEVGYAALMNRSFTDRAIAEQEGTGYTIGAGARFALGSSSFLQFSYKYRIQSIKSQDSKDLDEPIEQTDGYPLAGLGFLF